MCCGKKMQVLVPKGYDYQEITVQCGNTQPDGDPYLCGDCAVKLKDVNWRQRAAEFGESYDNE